MICEFHKYRGNGKIAKIKKRNKQEENNIYPSFLIGSFYVKLRKCLMFVSCNFMS